MVPDLILFPFHDPRRRQLLKAFRLVFHVLSAVSRGPCTPLALFRSGKPRKRLILFRFSLYRAFARPFRRFFSSHYIEMAPTPPPPPPPPPFFFGTSPKFVDEGAVIYLIFL